MNICLCGGKGGRSVHEGRKRVEKSVFWASKKGHKGDQRRGKGKTQSDVNENAVPAEKKRGGSSCPLAPEGGLQRASFDRKGGLGSGRKMVQSLF